MLTLTENPVELTPEVLRFAALFAISVGFPAAAELRTRSAGTAREATDKQIADEMDCLAWCGFTQPVATTVLDERDRSHRALRQQPCSEDAARREVRKVAGAFLDWKGPEAAGFCREIASTTARDGDGELNRSFTEFADAAEQLLTERRAGSLN